MAPTTGLKDWKEIVSRHLGPAALGDLSASWGWISGRPPKARHLCVIPEMLWTQPGCHAQTLAHFGLVSPPANVEQGGWGSEEGLAGLLVGMGTLSTVSGRAPA